MKKGMKWSAALLAAGVLVGGSGLTGGIPANAASATKPVIKQGVEPAVVLKYNGTTLTGQGKILNGNTMIPLTVLRDSLGLKVTYNPATKIYSLGTDFTKLNIENSDYGINTYLNGYYLYSKTNEYEVKNVNGHLYVPFKLLNDYMGYQGVFNPSLKSLDLSKRVMNNINISSETLDKSNQNATIMIQYPKISGLPDEVQQTMNAMFKQKAEDFAAASVEQASKRDGSIEQKYDFSQNFIVTFNRENVLSIVIDQSSYTGGAHGSTLREGITFSLKDGKQLGLDDLLKSAPNYKQTLDKKLKELTKKEAFDDVSAGLNENPNFYVREGGIAIFYQQYEIAPYAAGIPTYTFNFNELLPKGVNPFK
ncbi:PdaC/SigV domain-containing protein [Paenibacillus segetis]|uniref:Copper amine oxidase N-terminal domain-containing protein n=1 Tax=Paenibacillus segetis TaxID=1325360 RepID=A0ABQ1YM17_9BACL|nr:DUF4163 domain-containing protein [Paenibacillus segetis]GGH31237.1 hypothetical protein GCM10008013_34850 [Paenibacillus segetis]